jgi:hypothetical protein
MQALVIFLRIRSRASYATAFRVRCSRAAIDQAVPCHVLAHSRSAGSAREGLFIAEKSDMGVSGREYRL